MREGSESSMPEKKYYGSNYVHGNTVRKLEQELQYDRQEPLAAPREREQEQVKVRRHSAQNWDVMSLLFMLVAISIALFVCISYLQAQQNVTSMSKKIASMESEILALKNQNDAAYNKINSSVDLDYVYDVAVNELGMVHADKNQVQTYSNKKSDFVRQYGDVPDVKESSEKNKAKKN